MLCPSAMPDATVGEYYEESATFHLPLSWILVRFDRGLLVHDGHDGRRFAHGRSSPPTFCPRISPHRRRRLRLRGGLWHPLESGSFSVDLTVEVVASAFGVEETVFEFFSLPSPCMHPSLK